jgi:hypothetical protein
MHLAPPAVAAPDTFSLEPGVLQWLGTGLWGLAVLFVVRGLMAGSRVQKDLTDHRAQALTRLQTDHLYVVLREIVIFLRRSLDGRIREQDEDRIVPLLARADLGPQRRRLAEIAADAMDFERLQDLQIQASRRLGWAAAVFLLPWTYLLFWGSEKGVDLPVALTTAALGIAASAIGYGVAQAWQERTASVRFATLHRSYESGI